MFAVNLCLHCTTYYIYWEVRLSIAVCIGTTYMFSLFPFVQAAVALRIFQVVTWEKTDTTAAALDHQTSRLLPGVIASAPFEIWSQDICIGCAAGRAVVWPFPPVFLHQRNSISLSFQCLQSTVVFYLGVRESGKFRPAFFTLTPCRGTSHHQLNICQHTGILHRNAPYFQMQQSMSKGKAYILHKIEEVLEAVKCTPI